MTSDARDNVLTYSHEVVPPRWVRWMLRPIGWPYFSLLALACLWVLWESRVSEPISTILGAIILFVPSFGIILLFRFIMRLILWRVYRRPKDAFSTGLWRFGIPPIVALATFFLLGSGLPGFLAWKFSEPALRRHAQGVIAAESSRVPPATSPVTIPPRWVGLYEMQEIAYYPDVRGVRYYVMGAGFLFREGFAYLPAGLPGDEPGPGFETAYKPLEGDWYSAKESL